MTNLVDAEDVILRLQGKGFSSNNKIDVGHGRQTVAIYHILALRKQCMDMISSAI